MLPSKASAEAKAVCPVTGKQVKAQCTAAPSRSGRQSGQPKAASRPRGNLLPISRPPVGNASGVFSFIRNASHDSVRAIS